MNHFGLLGFIVYYNDVERRTLAMKYELGRCLLSERLQDSGMSMEELAQALHYKPEKLSDFVENKRIMPLKSAISIADTLGCEVNDLYELITSEPAVN
jgi:plasmid maintenance system antidote protein VapI